MAYKGKFRPKNPQKYRGDPTKIIYRSLWERNCMRYFDENPNVLKWSSEEVIGEKHTNHRLMGAIIVTFQTFLFV